MLTLKDFIRDSLVQIAEGVSESRESVQAVGGHVAPRNIYGANGGRRYLQVRNDESQYVHDVEFDVAVTATQEAGSKATIAVVAGAYRSGDQDERVRTDSVVSRIRFSVPVALP